MKLEQIFNIFITRLKDLMSEHNLSISQLAKNLNIPRITLNNYFLFRCTPKLDTLVTLADYFDVTVDYLLGREN